MAAAAAKTKAAAATKKPAAEVHREATVRMRNDDMDSKARKIKKTKKSEPSLKNEG